jgi:uncharacterized protein
VLKLSENLNLPADEAITQKYGFIGRSGSGKSYASMRLAELFLNAGAQIIALDWVGIWWSLRLASNGKDVGFPNVYIFGGEHQDVDLKPESGALMADLIVDKHISVVLDVMHFRKAERTRFATAFAEQFFHRKKTARSACHLFIEEAQAYLPQMVRGEEARMVGVFEDIGKVGRNYGIGTSLISQRPQAINKDVLNQVEVLLAFQTNGPQERKAIAGWTAENTTAGAAMIQELPKLHVGEALVWSPQWLRIAEKVHISKRDTYDASSTPKGNAKSIKPKTLAKADLEQLGEQIAATIEKAKADDPRELRKQIADLQRQLKGYTSKGITPSHIPEVKPPKRVEVPVLKDAQIARIEKLMDRFEKALGLAMGEHVIGVRGELQKLVASVQSFRSDADANATGHAGRLPERVSHSVVSRQHDGSQNARSAVASEARRDAHVRGRAHAQGVAASSNGDSGALGKAERAILSVLAQFPEGCDAGKLTLLSGYRYSGGFRNSLGTLRTAGYIVGSNTGTMQITPAGESAVGGDFEPLPTGEGLQRYWIAHRSFGACERAILTELVAHRNGLTADQLCQATGYEYSGGFRNSLGKLRTAGVLVGKNTDVMRAADVLFE